MDERVARKMAEDLYRDYCQQWSWFDVEFVEQKRTWGERLFTRPWHPWDRTKLVALSPRQTKGKIVPISARQQREPGEEA